MPKIQFIRADGTATQVEGDVGATLMEVAMTNGVEGILAECGGCCSCATCKCEIDPKWLAKTGSANEMEKEMLDAFIEANETSRLACQVEITAEMDGLIVQLPESQY